AKKYIVARRLLGSVLAHSPRTGGAPTQDNRHSLRALDFSLPLLASFLTLSAELVFIRRITKEIRLLYFPSPNALFLPIRKDGAERQCNQLRGLFAMRAHDLRELWKRSARALSPSNLASQSQRRIPKRLEKSSVQSPARDRASSRFQRGSRSR